MERQLKERLIGAAVLVAAAVVMVPEMFSGPRAPLRPATDAVAATTQLKTYRIELQSSRVAAPLPEATVAAPAERPQDESAQAPAEHAEIAASNTASKSSEPMAQSAGQASNKEVPARPVTSQPEVVAKPIAAKPDNPKSEPAQTKPTAGNWVVQVGSFAAQDKAQQIAGQLKGQGYPAFVGSVKVAGKTLYRVRVGAMTDRAAADAALQKLRASYPGASVVPANR